MKTFGCHHGIGKNFLLGREAGAPLSLLREAGGSLAKCTRLKGTRSHPAALETVTWFSFLQNQEEKIGHSISGHSWGVKRTHISKEEMQIT